MNEETFSLITKTAATTLKRQRVPFWRREFLVDEIVAKVLDTQVGTPLRGKELQLHVISVTRQIVHGEWHEVRRVIDGVRTSQSNLRIANPVLKSNGDYTDPLRTVGVDSWGKLTGFVLAYRGGTLCGFQATPKNKNIVEDRMIAWIDAQRTKERRRTKVEQFMLDYAANRRQGTPKTPAERVRFHRLKTQAKKDVTLALV